MGNTVLQIKSCRFCRSKRPAPVMLQMQNADADADATNKIVNKSKYCRETNFFLTWPLACGQRSLGCNVFFQPSHET